MLLVRCPLSFHSTVLCMKGNRHSLCYSTWLLRTTLVLNVDRDVQAKMLAAKTS
jgi:hypothetical protein